MKAKKVHKRLWKACHGWKAYLAGKLGVDMFEADCSCGCKFFIGLTEELGGDWGVCANPKSPRAGLLTFEHMGCGEFKKGRGE